MYQAFRMFLTLICLNLPRIMCIELVALDAPVEAAWRSRLCSIMNRINCEKLSASRKIALKLTPLLVLNPLEKTQSLKKQLGTNRVQINDFLDQMNKLDQVERKALRNKARTELGRNQDKPS